MFSVNRRTACIPSALDCIKPTKIPNTNIKLHPIVWCFIQFRIPEIALEFYKGYKRFAVLLKASSVTINRTFLDWIETIIIRIELLDCCVFSMY